MSDRTGKKRKKAYYIQASKRPRGQLQTGMRGFLITCNNREKEAVKEACNLLEQYAEKLFGPEKTADATSNVSSESEEEDIEAALNKEVAAIKETTKTAPHFQQVQSGANNCIFIRTTIENPYKMVQNIFSDVLSTGQAQSRHILRLLPVIGTCRADVDKLDSVMPEILEPYFKDREKCSYSIQFKVRNNTGCSRTVMIPAIGRVIENINSQAYVNHDQPDLIVQVDVLKTVLCVSVLEDFDKFKKYNLQQVALSVSSASSGTATAPKDLAVSFVPAATSDTAKSCHGEVKAAESTAITEKQENGNEQMSHTESKTKGGTGSVVMSVTETNLDDKNKNVEEQATNNDHVEGASVPETG